MGAAVVCAGNGSATKLAGASVAGRSKLGPTAHPARKELASEASSKRPENIFFIGAMIRDQSFSSLTSTRAKRTRQFHASVRR
jgi:hypothetical protein